MTGPDTVVTVGAMTLDQLIKAVGRRAIADVLDKPDTPGALTQVSRYAAGGRPMTLTQAARLRRAFPQLDLNEAAEALLVLEEERERGEG